MGSGKRIGGGCLSIFNPFPRNISFRTANTFGEDLIGVPEDQLEKCASQSSRR
jgi:hypothetical protein